MTPYYMNVIIHADQVSARKKVVMLMVSYRYQNLELNTCIISALLE